MRPPQDYIDMVEEFLDSDLKAAKIEGANREDMCCLRMVAYMRDLDGKSSIDILTRKGTVYVRRHGVDSGD